MVGSIILFLIILSILVLVHEWGHFFAARRLGVWVEEFGLGIPPKAWGKKIGETLYSLNWLPFGGFVRLHGENNEDAISKPDRAFRNKSKKARALIVSAGVIMNFVLAIVAFGIVYSVTGVPRQTGNVSIMKVSENSPAHTAGLVAGDVVRQVNGTQVSSTEEFISEVDKYDTAVLVVERGGDTIEIEASPRDNPPEGEGSLGVVISSSENYFPPLLLRPFYGVYFGFKEAIFWTGLVLSGFGMIISSLLGGQVPAGVSGPVGIYALTTEAAKFGWMALINFIGILSVNLAILNILPIPALDGGRLLFIVFEAIFGKKVLPRIENYLHLGGFILLIGILILITISDVTKLITAGGIAGFLETFTAP